MSGVKHTKKKATTDGVVFIIRVYPNWRVKVERKAKKKRTLHSWNDYEKCCTASLGIFAICSEKWRVMEKKKRQDKAEAKDKYTFVEKATRKPTTSKKKKKKRETKRHRSPSIFANRRVVAPTSFTERLQVMMRKTCMSCTTLLLLLLPLLALNSPTELRSDTLVSVTSALLFVRIPVSHLGCWERSFLFSKLRCV